MQTLKTVIKNKRTNIFFEVLDIGQGKENHKAFVIKNGKVTLQPANSSMKPIQVDAENVQVQGRVVGVIRSI